MGVGTVDSYRREASCVVWVLLDGCLVTRHAVFDNLDKNVGGFLLRF